MSGPKILLIEPFYGGSHKQLIDLIHDLFLDDSALWTMPAKKWHWRAITSALHFAQEIPKKHDFRVLLCSSVLPLSDLLSLRPDLSSLRKVVYFHENQLHYPRREDKKRYFQHGYNDILTCLVADCVLFNSAFNRDSFLSGIGPFLRLMPDHRPKGLSEQILPKCHVLPFPLLLPPTPAPHVLKEKNTLHIVWPHRWEHDKDPDTFFSVLFQLKDSGESFHLSVIGESFSQVPPIFEEAKVRLRDHIVNWGFADTKEDYWRVLAEADVAVSTATHEFFGVAMLEAAAMGCYPLCPNRLAYPEIYPAEHLYNTPAQLQKRLRNFCRHPHLARKQDTKVCVEKFSWDTLKEQYRTHLNMP